MHVLYNVMLKHMLGENALIVGNIFVKKTNLDLVLALKGVGLGLIYWLSDGLHLGSKIHRVSIKV